MDPYAVLSISRDASKEEIKSAFRTLAKKHHPDKGGTAEKFREIVMAYEAAMREPISITDFTMDFGDGSSATGYSTFWGAYYMRDLIRNFYTDI